MENVQSLGKTSWREIIRAFLFQRKETVTLEAAVDKFHRETLFFKGAELWATFHSSLFGPSVIEPSIEAYLILELGNSGNDSRYHTQLSQLWLGYRFSAVREIYELLNSGNSANFKGLLSVHADRLWDREYRLPLHPPITAVRGRLSGELSLGGRNYLMEFYMPVLPYKSHPVLERIDCKSF